MIITVLSSHRKSIYQKKNVSNNRITLFVDDLKPSVGGLGGGNVWGVTHWNYYGHYASFSGWESITHEFMHCMGYGHSSNMTYASGGVGWTEFMWQLHTYLRGNDWLPYTDRNLLGFHKPENAKYRDGGIDPDKLNVIRFCSFIIKVKLPNIF